MGAPVKATGTSCLRGRGRESIMKRHLVIGSALVVLLASLGIGQALLEKRVTAQTNGATQAPRFEVDPMWPKPLPNGWYLGQTIGVGVDANDHVWSIHRSDSLH